MVLGGMADCKKQSMAGETYQRFEASFSAALGKQSKLHSEAGTLCIDSKVTSTVGTCLSEAGEVRSRSLSNAARSVDLEAVLLKVVVCKGQIRRISPVRH